MNVINRIFRKKEEFNRLDERVVWGIWAQRRLQLVYKMLAADLRVPISVLVGHVLLKWLAQNKETILGDKNKKVAFADYLAENYLSKD
ncbi:hypothetical protein ACFLWV_00530 [Chloroflexota bacterium]